MVVIIADTLRLTLSRSLLNDSTLSSASFVILSLSTRTTTPIVPPVVVVPPVTPNLIDEMATAIPASGKSIASGIAMVYPY